MLNHHLTLPVLLVLIQLYFLSGLIYTLIHVWVYRPSEEEALLGLMVLGWPLYLVLDLVLTLARGFGIAAMRFNRRVQPPAASTTVESPPAQFTKP